LRGGLLKRFEATERNKGQSKLSVQEIAEMPRFFFDVKNGRLLVDPAGADRDGDVAARKHGIAIAKQIAADAPKSKTHRIAVRDNAGREVAIISVRTSS
jgi:hypothetical protein